MSKSTKTTDPNLGKFVLDYQNQMTNKQLELEEQPMTTTQLGFDEKVSAKYIVDSATYSMDGKTVVLDTRYNSGTQHRYMYLAHNCLITSAVTYAMYKIDHDEKEDLLIMTDKFGNKISNLLNSDAWCIRINTGYTSKADEAIQLAVKQLLDAHETDVAAIVSKTSQNDQEQRFDTKKVEVDQPVEKTQNKALQVSLTDAINVIQDSLRTIINTLEKLK